MPPKTVASRAELNVKQFVAARAAEIALLSRDVAESSQNRTVHQAVPRFLRRRQASHHPYRLPFLRVARAIQEKRANEIAKRAALTKAQAEQKKRRRLCRSRRRNFVAETRGRPDFLPTHVWHAKRCEMRLRWGVRVAVRRHTKGLRVCLTAATRKTAVHDQSYDVVLRAPADADLAPLFPEVAPLLARHDPRVRIATVGPEGPVMILRATASWYLVVHPAGADALLQRCISAGVAAEQHHRVGVFELIGPEAGRRVLQALDPAPACSPHTATFLGVPTLSAPSGVVVPYSFRVASVGNPRSHFSPNTPASPSDNQPEAQHPQDQTKQPKTGGEQPQALVVDESADLGVRVEDGSTLPEQTHAAESTKPADGQPSAKPLTHAAFNAVFAADEVAAATERVFAAGTFDPADTPAVVVHNRANASDGSHFGSGYFLLVPLPAALVVWRRLTWHCCLPLALHDREYLAFEAGCLTFPADYPDTPFGRDALAETRQELVDANARRPPAKRFDTTRFAVDGEVPWDWSLTAPVVRRRELLTHDWAATTPQDDTRLVRFELSSCRGRPKQFSYVYLPDSTMLADFARNGFALAAETPQNPLGRVIRGGFSLRRGSGYAIGYCRLAALKHALDSRPELALPNTSVLVAFRTPFSSVLHAGVLTPVP